MIQSKTERVEAVGSEIEVNPVTITFTPDTDELRKICGLPTGSALRRAAAFLAGLARDPAFAEYEILPLQREAKGREDWYVARRHDGEDGSLSLKVFVWPAGTGTKVHDHSSWGAYRCASGAVLEERYERLDDGRGQRSWPTMGGVPRPAHQTKHKRTPERLTRPKIGGEVRVMRETCYCGRTGEIEDREPVATEDGKRALRCPDCGHLDLLDWLPEKARRPVFGEAERRQRTAA